MPAACDALVGDIEDLHTLEITNNPTTRKQQLFPRVKKKNAKQSVVEKVVADSIIPGTQSIYVKTWGCAHNTSDSEYMAGLLAAYGYHITEDPEISDLWLLNSCTVKSPAEDHFHNAINSGLEKGKHVVVAGCVPQASPKAPYLQGLSVVGVQQIDRVVEVVEETLKGNSVRLLGPKKNGKKKMGGASLQLPKIRRNPLIEIIAINTGCLNQCTYCKTKHARGELGSYPPEEIIERAKQAFQEGVREIWLTSEDTGTYGRDIGVTLPDLLYQLVEVIPDRCMLRLGMTNPPYIMEHVEDMVRILSHPRVYSFLHIPVQSASDAVLSDMKREYCIADFKKLVDFLRQKVPGITIATDIICGFPTESNEDFDMTVALVEEYKFPSLFINQFYPRPGTPAARLQRIPAKEVKQRTKRLTEVFHTYQPYLNRVGQQYEVLVTEVSHDKKHFVGHNKYYEQILLPKDDMYIGQVVLVQISKVGKHYMIGMPVEIKTRCESLPCPLLKGQVSGVNSVLASPASPSQQKLFNEKTTCSESAVTSKIWLWTSVIVLIVALIVRVSSALPKF